MKHRDLISVIIPANNAEKYIERCIRSVQIQTYENIEIIVVNDGSKDGTLEILKRLQEKEQRIKIINKNNEGVSQARNDGIDSSIGKYLYFIDSDDYIEKDMIEKLHKYLLCNECELSVCGFSNVFDDLESRPYTIYSDYIKLDRQEYLKKMSEYLYSVYFGALWNKLYITKIIKEKNIRFRKDISLAEDFILNLEYLEYVENVAVIPETLYNYYQGNSKSLTKNKDPQYLWTMAKIRLYYCIEQYKKMNVFQQCKTNIYTAIANELVGPTYHIFQDGIFLKEEKKEKLKEIYDNELVKTAITMTKQPQMVHRIAKFSIKIKSYGIFIFLMKIWIKVQKIMKAGKNG